LQNKDKSTTPAASSTSDEAVRQLVDSIPNTRPLLFRYEMEKFQGDRSGLYAAVLELLRIQTSPVARVHAGMALMCMGNPLGVEILLATLRGPAGRARTHALGQLRDIWSYDVQHSTKDKEKLPVTAEIVAKALIPLLATPETDDGKIALEFCLRHACVATVPYTRAHLNHLDSEIRWRTASAFLDHGINEGALTTATKHFLAPLPQSPEALQTWRRTAEIYGSHIASAFSQPQLRGDVVKVAAYVINKTLSMPDAVTRTWFNVDHRTGAGYFNHLLGVLSRANTPDTNALLLQTIGSLSVAPYSRANAALLVAQSSGSAPDGAEESVCAMVQDKKVSDCGRNPLLEKCGVALGASAVSGLLLALHDPDLRRVAAQSLSLVASGQRDDEIRRALQSALRAETRDWVAADMASALTKRGCTDDATIDALDPWQAMNFRWKQQGVTKEQVAQQLTEAGAMNPIGQEALDALQGKEADGESLLMSLLTHGGEHQYRLGHCAMRSDEFNPRHDELFAQLAGITRPPLDIESISQTRSEVQTVQDAKSAGLMMWQDGEWKPSPEQLLGDAPIISFEGTTCTVRYVYRGQEHGFVVPSNGSSMNVSGVVGAFNEFMRQLDRSERAFRLKGPRGDDAWALFLCANEAAFRRIAKQLHIPLLQ